MPSSCARVLPRRSSSGRMFTLILTRHEYIRSGANEDHGTRRLRHTSRWLHGHRHGHLALELRNARGVEPSSSVGFDAEGSHADGSALDDEPELIRPTWRKRREVVYVKEEAPVLGIEKRLRGGALGISLPREAHRAGRGCGEGFESFGETSEIPLEGLTRDSLGLGAPLERPRAKAEPDGRNRRRRGEAAR